MRLIPIVYDYELGPIHENHQRVIEVTDDIIDLLDNYDVMIVKNNNKIIVKTDTKGKRFKQR